MPTASQSLPIKDDNSVKISEMFPLPNNHDDYNPTDDFFDDIPFNHSVDNIDDTSNVIYEKYTDSSLSEGTNNKKRKKERKSHSIAAINNKIDLAKGGEYLPLTHVQ